MEKFYGKVQESLKRNGVQSTIQEVRNSFQASLPSTELLGDMLRDGEEVIVVLRGNDGQLMQDRSTTCREVTPVPAPASPSRRTPRAADTAAGVSRVNMEIPQNGDAHQRGPHTLMAVPQGRGQFGIIGGGDDAARILPVKAAVTLPPQVVHEDESDEDDYDDDDDTPMAPIEDYPPMPHMPRGAPAGAAGIPGPSEEFEIERLPYETMKVDHPCDPVQLTSYDNDWLVENLSPRLREFILSRFQPDLITEPKYVPSIGKFVGAKFLQTSGSFVSVFMRPQTAISSDANATMPVHYNIPKSELYLFQRQAQSQIDELQQHQEVFKASLRALNALIGKGMSESELVNNMLPHTYDAYTEVEGTMLEAEKPLLPMSKAGSYPVIVVDTSGAVAEHLPYVRAAIKRCLHLHVAGKAGFQLLRFNPATGEPRLWAQDMMAPTDTALQAAEDWLDQLSQAGGGNLVKAVRFALAFKQCDEVYIISSASSYKESEHDHVIANMRLANKREVAIHTIGVEPEPMGELLLRNISESNHGDFTLKSFRAQGVGRANAVSRADSRWTSWRTNLVNEKSRQLSDSFKAQRMGIGSQIKILEVMCREEAQKEGSWHEEWRCAQRLLSSQKDPRAGVPDRDMVKELESRATRTFSARVGGGFVYDTQEVDIGMEKLFEHKSAVSWTATSETLAVGPKVPLPDADWGRAAMFPPSLETMRLSPAQESELQPGRPASGSRNRPQEVRKKPGLPPGGSNPWAPDRTVKPKAAPSSRGRGSSSSRRRAESADRAAGTGRAASPGRLSGRAASPGRLSARTASPGRQPGTGRKRSQTPPKKRGLPQVPGAQPRAPPAPPPAPPSPPTPGGLERRWSF
eukprot:TRINITY_DN5459_c0_g1_i1.p1 TRINITY_DN5459_c0_g1~~TRINITY_DN5459_c0_g1_i1.p1  ORF type:complete len:914 (+),score=200.36 TRINITY_DN5459_c0_g1_i1:167-2743(+)